VTQHIEAGSSATVSLLFTDIDGSTRLIEQLGDGYATLLEDHHRILDEVLFAHGGTRIDAAGDGLFISFPSARAGLLASIDAQRAKTGKPEVTQATRGASPSRHRGTEHR
jgi:class 3 adenylate cyclase